MINHESKKNILIKSVSFDETFFFRFARLDSLQKICRFVIRQTVSEDLWNKLPLPPNLIAYVSLGSDYIATL